MSIDLDSQEVKDAIAAAVAEEVAGLKAKNAELIAKNKKLQQGASVDPADVEALERQLDEWKAKAGEASKAAAKAAKDLEAASKRAEQAESYTTKLLVDNGLNDALAKAGVVNPVHQKAAKAMLAGQAQVIADGDQKVVRVGDKALADFVKEWAGGDEGKHFVTAPDAGGAGSGPSGRITPPTKPVKEWSESDKGRFIRENGLPAWQELLEKKTA
jgi:hypothetical protein